MDNTADTLLRGAEQTLQDLSAMLPYAAGLEPHASSPEVYAFFKRLTRRVLCDPGEHIQLFAHCLDAVIAHDPVEGAVFLEKMLCLSDGVEKAAESEVGILH
jgi:hypothetical protein